MRKLGLFDCSSCEASHEEWEAAKVECQGCSGWSCEERTVYCDRCKAEYCRRCLTSHLKQYEHEDELFLWCGNCYAEVSKTKGINANKTGNGNA